MTSFKDWVVETSSTTGTGSYNLSGSAPAGTSYFTFRQRYANGDDKVVYWVTNQDATKWERNRFGTLTYGSPDTLSRNVIESTNGDAPVSWVGGDAPLLVYVVPDAEAQEFAITMGLGAARPDVLRFGIWADEDGLATGFDQIKHFDGTSDDVIGVVNRTTHQATIYGLPPGFLYGMTLSRSSATAIGIAAGTAIDSTNVVGIRLGSAITKSTAGSWVTGTAQNGMADSVTIGNSTWYHVFAGLADGVADAFIDSSVSAANAPSEFTHFRRIGSFRTDGSAQIINFVQDGDFFQWLTIISDVAANAPGTSAVTRTLTVPTGVPVIARVILDLTSASTTTACYAALTDLAIADADLAQTAQVQNAAGFVNEDRNQIDVRTNTSAQIRSRVGGLGDANVSISIFTHGWFDRRGKDA